MRVNIITGQIFYLMHVQISSKIIQMAFQIVS